MTKQGSIMVTVLMLLGALTIIAFTVLRNNTFLMDSALAHEQYEWQYRATEGLMRYGIAFAHNYFNQIKAQQKEKELNVGAWPRGNRLYTGSILLKPDLEQNSLYLEAKLHKEAIDCCVISCALIQNEGNWIIHNWKIN